MTGQGLEGLKNSLNNYRAFNRSLTKAAICLEFTFGELQSLFFMKQVFIFTALLFSVAGSMAQSSLRNLERITINGSSYVRLREWAAATSFDVRWLKKDEELQVTNRFWKLNFTVNSMKTRINGIDVRFSLPVISRNGTVLLPLVDVHNSLHPLLFPPKNPASQKIKTICLDPGHGGRDTGKIDKRHLEKKYTLLVAEEIAQQLRRHGFRVILTRTKDDFVPLADRPAMANRNRADLFISLHFNAAENAEVRGAETYCLTPAGVESSNSGGGRSSAGGLEGNAQNEHNMLLAYQIQKNLVLLLRQQDRGVKRARYEVLRSAKMPAVLVEAAFMSNTSEAQKIYDPAFRKRMATAVVEGILNYKKIVE